jgi:hypothetical protein
MSHIARIGIDTPKAVFTLHCVDDTGRAVLPRPLGRLRRSRPRPGVPARTVRQQQQPGPMPPAQGSSYRPAEGGDQHAGDGGKSQNLLPQVGGFLPEIQTYP